MGNETVARGVRNAVRNIDPHVEVVTIFEEKVSDNKINSMDPEQGHLNNHQIKSIRKTFRDYKLDLVLISHDMGYGLFRASLVPEDLWDKTLVVLNGENDGTREAYGELGLKNFTLRDNLGQSILDLCRVLMPS